MLEEFLVFSLSKLQACVCVSLRPENWPSVLVVYLLVAWCVWCNSVLVYLVLCSNQLIISWLSLAFAILQDNFSCTRLPSKSSDGNGSLLSMWVARNCDRAMLGSVWVLCAVFNTALTFFYLMFDGAIALWGCGELVICQIPYSSVSSQCHCFGRAGCCKIWRSWGFLDHSRYVWY